VDPRVSLDAVAKGKKSHHGPRREFTPGFPARSLVCILTELSRLILADIYFKMSVSKFHI